MNGATAEPSVSTISTDRSSIVTTIGPSHHFLRTLMKAQSSPKIDMRPPLERAIQTPCERTDDSVELEALAPVEVLVQLGLALLAKDLVAEHEGVHLGPHEAEIGIVRRAHDRLAADVERGVDQHRAARP